MTCTVVIRTVFPILFLISIGFLSRKTGLLKSGDERVLSSYVYYFALPALFFIDLAETSFVGETLLFVYADIIPVLGAIAIYILLFYSFRFSKNTLYLLVLSTVFGSLAFFGIAFITFAFGAEQSEHLVTSAAASIGIVAIATSIMVLELYRLSEASVWEGLRHVAARLSRNPLILSIVVGILISVVGVELPFPLSTSLHMLGRTTSAVAVFMLGAFL